jgi:hypothetical protein
MKLGEKRMTNNNYRQTQVTIHGEDFYINGEPTYQGRYWNGIRMEGRLMNSRMVQAIFDDKNQRTARLWAYPDTGRWDADRNTREFIAAMPEWKAHGLTAFTLNLQGGSPEGYSKRQPWHNSAFLADGSLDLAYMNRLEAILDRVDELGMAVILGYFYFGQELRLQSELAVKQAAANATVWLMNQGYGNVLVEISNECNIVYKHPILLAPRAHELIEFVRVLSRAMNPERPLPVGTSFSGGVVPTDEVIRSSDFLLLHGNDTPLEWLSQLVDIIRDKSAYRGQPIVFNEDDHFDFEAEDNHMIEAVRSGASWGYFDPGANNYRDGYQCPPIQWGLNTERKQAFFRLLKEMTMGDGDERP